jgi:hypothetical protein
VAHPLSASVIVVIVAVLQSVHAVPQVDITFVDPVSHDTVGEKAHAVCCAYEQHPSLGKAPGPHGAQ